MEVPKGLVGVPPAVVAVLACCAAQNGEDSDESTEAALALLSVAAVPIASKTDDSPTSSRYERHCLPELINQVDRT